MAASTLSPSTTSQLCSTKNGLFSSSQAFMLKPTMRTQLARKEKGYKNHLPGHRHSHGQEATHESASVRCHIPPHGWHVGSLCFLLCPTRYGQLNRMGGAGGGIVAKDALGNDVIASEWLKNHGPGDRTLTQGLKGDPTYLVVENDRSLATYGINAVCTHLGCVVPWNAAENKFVCPCHGSQYNNQGRVVRGPAPLSLALAHADIDDGKVVFVPWVETDFRIGDTPWWA